MNNGSLPRGSERAFTVPACAFLARRVLFLAPMLFRQDILAGIARGTITVAFRRWRRATVKEGGTLRTRAGVLAFDAVEKIALAKITDEDARAAGYESREALLVQIAKWKGAPRGGRRGTAGPRDPLYRVRFHVAGEDPRVALRKRSRLTAAERAAIDARLARLDAASARGPWTRVVLRLIAKRPATRAPDLAASLGRETLPFKRDVRKLKELGLTESLDVGYRLSPTGRAYLLTR